MTGSRPPKPKRRWYQFSLRTLMLFVLAAGLGLGLLGRWIRQAQDRRIALIALQKSGASIECRNRVRGLPNAVLWKLFGDESLPVVWLDLRGTRISDAGLVHLRSQRSIESLMLTETRVTDAGLIHLEGLSSLRELHLKDTRITDDGLRHLEGLTGLEELFIEGTQVTGTGMVHLKGLNSLQWLTLDGTLITDAELQRFEGLNNLLILELYHTQVTDDGVKKLREALPNCWIYY